MKKVESKKKLGFLTTVSALVLVAVTYTHCGKNARIFIPSDNELSAITQQPFDVNNNLTSVSGGDQCASGDLDCKKFCEPSSPNFDSSHPLCLGDSPRPNGPGVFTSSCDFSDYDNEKQIALAEVELSKTRYNQLKTFCDDTASMNSADKLNEFNQLSVELRDAYTNEAGGSCSDIYKVIRIPIRFAISSGLPHDWISHMAYSRSILRSDHTGESYIMGGDNCRSLGGCGVSWGARNNFDVPYYIVNHTEARNSYTSGAKKYFSTVSIKNHIKRTGVSVGNKGIPDFPGFSFWSWSRHMMYSNSRLKDRVENANDVSIVPLYVADFRPGILSQTFPSLIRDVSQYSRGSEYLVSANDIFNLPNIWANFSQISNNLCSAREKLPAYKVSVTLKNNNRTGNYGRGGGPFDYAGYDGCNQLLQNFFCSTGTVLPLMYTPLVVDLGRKHIRTSSIKWGSYFNFALPKHPTTGEYVKISHKTSWIGGYLDTPSGERLTERRSEDGFLVLPKSGAVEDARQMFGTKMSVEGQTFSDGFKAIQAFTKKDCSSASFTERYLGPWDKGLFEGEGAIKVWVDSNRDGLSNADEIMSLKDAGIAAINTCFVEHDQTYDRFNNKTELRSAFLYVKDEKDFFDKENLEDEIISRIKDGVGLDGKKAEFRVMIDIYFNSRPKEFLEKLDFEPVFKSDEEASMPKGEKGAELVRDLSVLRVKMEEEER